MSSINNSPFSILKSPKSRNNTSEHSQAQLDRATGWGYNVPSATRREVPTISDRYGEEYESLDE